jgi:hypothetical protein
MQQISQAISKHKKADGDWALASSGRVACVWWMATQQVAHSMKAAADPDVAEFLKAHNKVVNFSRVDVPSVLSSRRFPRNPPPPHQSIGL